MKFPLEMAQDAIYPGTAIPETKYASGQIVLTVPPSGTESVHLARATQSLDGPFLLTPLQSTAKHSARCYTGGDSPGLLFWICLQGYSSGPKPGWASWVQTCSLQERLFCPCFSSSLHCYWDLYKSTTTSVWYKTRPSTVASWLRKLLLRAFRGRALRAR